LFLQVPVEHLNELLRRKEPLAPDCVVLRGRLGGDHLLQRLARLDLPPDGPGNRRQHVAVRLEIGLARERAVPGDDLRIIARSPEPTVTHGSYAGYRAAARGVAERIELVEQGV